MIEKYSINIEMNWFTDDYKSHLEKKIVEIIEELKVPNYDLQYYELKIDQVSWGKDFNFKPAP